jgi:hypothetical protein
MMTHDVSQPVTAQSAVFTAIFVRALPLMTGVTGYRGQFANARVRAHAGLLPNTRHNPSFRHCERTAARIVLPAAVRIAPRRAADMVGCPPPSPRVAAPSGGTTRARVVLAVFSPCIPAPYRAFRPIHDWPGLAVPALVRLSGPRLRNTACTGPAGAGPAMAATPAQAKPATLFPTER